MAKKKMAKITNDILRERKWNRNVKTGKQPTSISVIAMKKAIAAIAIAKASKYR